MDFYGVRSWTDKAIFMRKHRIVPREPGQRDCEFSLFSPQDENQDIGALAYKIRDVFGLYRNRYRLMTNFNFKRGESILKCLVNPNDQVFCFLKE